MSWLRIEGRMPQHHKIAPLSDAAFRLHVTAMAWSVEAKSDGHLPTRVPATLTRAPQGKKLKDAVAELVEAGAWRPETDGHVIHDFLDWNLSAAELTARSEAKAKAGAAGGRRSTESRSRQAAASARPQAAAQADTRPPAEPSAQAPAEADHQAAAQAESKPSPLSDQNTDPRSTAAESQDLTGFPRENPGLTVAEAAEAPLTALQHKYQLCSRNPGYFALEGGVRWPEFLAVWHAWSRPFGITEPPSITQRVDRDILVIIEAFASGKTLEQLLAAGKAAETDDYFKTLSGAGPASFTPAVLRRLLAPKREVTARGRRGGPPQPDTGVDPFAKHDAAKAGAP